MKPLDPQIRRLLDDVSSADLAPAHLEEQLWQQLAPRLGGALPPTAAAASSTLVAKTGLFAATSPIVKLSLAALVAGASVTAVVQHRSATNNTQPATRAVVAAVPAASVASNVTHPAARARVVDAAGMVSNGAGQQQSVAPNGARVSGAAMEQGPESAPPSRVAQRSSRAAGTRKSRGEDAADGGSMLVAETELLARAQRAMRNGKPALALPLIEQHAKAHPTGSLAQERDAARVLALCTLGRTEEARRYQRRFLSTWPGSPLSTRVQNACKAEPQLSEKRSQHPKKQ